MTHPVALESLQFGVAANVFEQFLRIAQHGTAHSTVIDEFFSGRLCRRFAQEVVRVSCLLEWRRRRISVLVVGGRELLILLQVVHELVDVEILEAGGAKVKSKIKTNQCWNARNLRVQQVVDFRFNFDFDRLFVPVHCRPDNCSPISAR